MKVVEVVLKAKGWLRYGIYAPVFGFLVVFGLVPAVGLVIGSLSGSSGVTSEFYQQSMQGQYYHAFITTFWLSLESAAIGLVWGTVITWSVTRIRVVWVERMVIALASTMANFAGLPLAIAFMATLGASGMFTSFLNHVLAVNLAQMGWNLASEQGLLVIYTTFQTPLAVILLLPAIKSLESQWEEAVYTLGASLWTYLGRVALPILLPGLFGTFALLFANSFSAYVTAYAISGGSINLLPLQIGYLIDGNVTLNMGLGDALAVEEMVVLALSLGLFLVMSKLQSTRMGRGKKQLVA